MVTAVLITSGEISVSLRKLPLVNANHYFRCTGVNVQESLKLSAQFGAGHTTVHTCTGVREVAGHGTGQHCLVRVIWTS